MEPNAPTASVADDVLHIESKSKLSPEEIAKARAHHNRHHPAEPQKQAASKQNAGKKHK